MKILGLGNHGKPVQKLMSELNENEDDYIPVFKKYRNFYRCHPSSALVGGSGWRRLVLLLKMFRTTRVLPAKVVGMELYS